MQRQVLSILKDCHCHRSRPPEVGEAKQQQPVVGEGQRRITQMAEGCPANSRLAKAERMGPSEMPE